MTWNVDMVMSTLFSDLYSDEITCEHIMQRKTIAATRVDNSCQCLYNGDTREADHTHVVK